MANSQRTVLVTGGAGYIGSHVVLQLRSRGEQVVVLDNLTTGFRQAIEGTCLIEGDVGDVALVEHTLDHHTVDCVMHFAANTVVPESVREPLKYYGNNTCATRHLLDCCQRLGVKQFVFSSTAAVYGIPDGGVASEESRLAPINPYGTSKLMSEWILRDLAAVTDLRYVCFRYFNVAGSDTEGRVGQVTRGSSIVKIACEAMVGKRPHVIVYGSDFDTCDGTGVRDYIHVEDLARAHLHALDYLRSGGSALILNCGYGRGYSVREVLQSVERVAKRKLKVCEEPRRPGDPPTVIAQAARIRDILGWKPHLDDLDTIVQTALQWEVILQRKSW